MSLVLGAAQKEDDCSGSSLSLSIMNRNHGWLQLHIRTRSFDQCPVYKFYVKAVDINIVEGTAQHIFYIRCNCFVFIFHFHNSYNLHSYLFKTPSLEDRTGIYFGRIVLHNSIIIIIYGNCRRQIAGARPFTR